MPAIPFLLFVLQAALLNVAMAGEGTYPLAYITGPQIIENSTHVPARADSANATVWNGTLWTVKWHGDKNYSIHHINAAKYDKCISTRWDHHRGLDDAAVMWQCEVDNITRVDIDFDIYPNFRGIHSPSDPQPLEKRRGHYQKRYINNYEAIRSDKQQWLFMRHDPARMPEWDHVRFDPVRGENVVDGTPVFPSREENKNSGTNVFYLVSAAHLWNMKPRCIYPTASYEFTFTPNNTGVTALDHCFWGNTSQLWEMTLWKPATFPLGFEPDPRFVVDEKAEAAAAAYLIWNAYTMQGSTVLWWAILVMVSFGVWIWQT
ncbi:hypothetical protein BX666DRAFT_1881199 [Dichotomocladium elegans]|nr:hypothetical protein BX666DRAFT_1881199 [Dichotomocladium elegans]